MEILPIIEPLLGRFMIQRAFAERLERFVMAVALSSLGHPAVPLENALRISVNHEAVMASRIEQHAVSRLGSDAVDVQQALAHERRLARKETAQIRIKFLDQHAQKRSQAPRLHIEVACRSNQFSKVRLR